MHERLIQWIVIVSEVLLPLTRDVLSLIKLTMLTIYGLKVYERILAISVERVVIVLCVTSISQLSDFGMYENTLVTFEKPFLLFPFFFFSRISRHRRLTHLRNNQTYLLWWLWHDSWMIIETVGQHLYALDSLNSCNFQRISFNDISLCLFYELLIRSSICFSF